MKTNVIYNTYGDDMKKELTIIEVIDKIRPFLISDGGNIEFVKYENNIVYIKMAGACAECQLIDFTLKDLVLTAIQEEVPEVEDVVNVGNNESQNVPTNIKNGVDTEEIESVE